MTFAGEPSPLRAGSGYAPLLRIENLSKVFAVNQGFLTALQDIRFSVDPGEMVCIVGRSGCGKSTLLKLLAGFLRPTAGRILLSGRPIGRPGPGRCVVFQEDALFPWLTVGENVAFGLQRKSGSRAERRHRVAHYLDLVGLKEFGDYLPNEISGGMKQRVALARVLILEPGILLMDEPFAALDSQTREEMQFLLMDIQQALSQTILFVTHDVNEAVRLADRVLVMGRNPGRIRRDVEVALPRPRMGGDTDFLLLSRRLHQELRE